MTLRPMASLTAVGTADNSSGPLLAVERSSLPRGILSLGMTPA